jgi:hypothetical protein
MATLALQIAGTALGTFIGGPLGGAIGSALGGTLGAMADRAILGDGSRVIEGPRLTDLQGISASEGAPIPRAYGRVKLGGQVMWATEFEETHAIERAGSSGGKTIGAGEGGGNRTLRYSYFANVAIGLCEGPISLVRRIWADGEELDLAGLSFRIHLGSEDQETDPLIVAKQETADLPGFRGLAYVVFERFPLAAYGNRLPQFAFEVVRAAPGLPDALKAINLIPGSTEFGYATAEVREDLGYGASQAINRAQWTHATDWEASLDALQALAPNLERATLISAWFGDDLRAGHCTFQPRIEKAGKATNGAEWAAAGLTRASATPVSATEGRPDYGGSPSDASVIAAIRDLKARGLGVALHPFVLMDIPAGNALPDPWSDAGAQPAFPWRGRITCDPAPGQPGSPEGTVAVEAEITTLVGTASPADFALWGDTVVYTGPDEWSYRRMVLHHAMLAKVADGVESFIIGSELVGLTHCSSGGGAFPFVAALIAIADDVRAILGPETTITYAADWTEYGARVRDDAVRFPLDPLWAHDEIGAIGIDFYPPLTDWRPGRDHLDAGIARNAADPAYIRERIASGESYDWYYANAGARDAQVRAPITDGAYAKPWIYRPKDLVKWWSQPHVERVGGMELGLPTAFVPMAKPILLTEIGCPAVDLGANQPNVFPDPKSSENALPHFSRGGRDDLVQRRVLEALIGRFDPGDPWFGDADNPVSPLYGGRMVDPGFTAPWAYDARPYPVFPRQRSLWADGENWLRGHWLNGRLEALPVDRLIGMIADDFGLEPPMLDALDGMIDGYLIERPMSARAAIEPLAGLFGLTAKPEGAGVAFRARPVAPVGAIALDTLVPDRDGGLVEITRRQESELPRQVSFGFIDDEADFRQAVAIAESGEATSTREQIEGTAMAMPRALGRRLAETRLHDLRAGRESFRFRMPPSALGFEPGDLVEIATLAGPRLALLTRITDGDYRECEARAYDPAFAEAGPSLDELPPEAGLPALPGAAYARTVELPLDRGGGLLAIAVRADPWRGPYAVMRTDGGDAEAPAAVLAPARIGTTMTTLAPGPLWRWDRNAMVDVTLADGAVSSLGEASVLAGGNSLALIAPEGEIEIVLFREAELVGVSRYRLSGLLRGLGGSEAAASRVLAPGATAIVLDEAITDIGLDAGDIGTTRSFAVLPAGRDLGDPSAVSVSATITGIARLPLAPVHARARREAGGLRITFIRRTRKDGDALDLFEVPLGEEGEDYRLDILDGETPRRSLSLASPEYLYVSADEIADFGTAQTALRLRIAQVSRVMGPGAAFDALVPIT